MKISLYSLFLFITLSVLLSSCDFIGNVFETGVWVGVIIVVLVIIGIIWLIRKMFD